MSKIKIENFKKQNLVIVIGGDGFMLKTLKKILILIKSFMVLTLKYGFLMNKFSTKNILKNLSRANKVSISPLE